MKSPGDDRRYRIDVAYDGTGYAGWQVQPNGVTVQEVLQEALHSLSGSRCVVHGSGRTDQGVHARRQVAHFDLKRELETKTIVQGLNAYLPEDVRVLAAARVSSDFHARRSVREKEYRYFIQNGPVCLPTERLYAAHVRNRLDVIAMREAAACLVGRHDFAAFAANPGREVESTVRDLFELRVSRRGSRIVVVARGEGFLYKMVRSLCGFLIRVGEGGEASVAAAGILAARQRTARVPTAPPQGLFLWNVRY